MQPVVDSTTIVKHGLAAHMIADDMSWAQGAIKPLADSNDSQARQLMDSVLDSLAFVADREVAYSCCTDGRLPVRLMNGDLIPVREQMVGADMVSAFYVAETLGERFYKDASAPVADRVREVAEFLKANGIVPSTHVGCGAAAGFTAVTENVGVFSDDERYLARLQALLPEGVYNDALHQTMIADSQERLKNGHYEGLSADTFMQAVEAVGGPRAIAELKDDGRGVHGHVEEAIVRIRVPDYAVNETQVAALTGGREVFGVNDLRMERLAQLFGRGNDDDYRVARMALEDFASSGHGTLSQGLPTYIVTAA